MILVIGATGMVGSEICSLLSKSGKNLRALVREKSNPDKVSYLKNLGVETLIGDLREISSYKESLNNVTHIITTVSSMPFSYVPGENDIQTTDLDGIINLIDVAKESGVQHFVYTSFSKQIDAGFPLEEAKRSVEKYLENSGMTYTILRPSYFMEVWLSPAVGFDIINENIKIYGEGNNPVSYISYKDVAKFAVESLENKSAYNKYLELGGPDKITQLDVVKIFEKIKNKRFKVQNVSVDALNSQMNSVMDPMQKSFTGLMISIANGDSIDMDETLKAFPLQLTSVSSYAKTL